MRDAGLGATYLGDGRSAFRVWAPDHEHVDVVLAGGEHRLRRADHGYHEGVVDGAPPGTRYRYRLSDGEVLADPASRSQPNGVHGPSAVVDHRFDWNDAAWRGPSLRDYVIYELHIATFTHDGTFDAAIQRLDDLARLGVTAVEVMPIAQFPGERNWGYDGVFPYAAQSTYGGLDGFRRFVNACHVRGLAVVLDVVYNHFGPEGAVQGRFGPYFTERFETPWGPAMNFDDAHADEVRRYFIENALWWIDDCHVDGLRLDAVHAMFDQSAVHFLDELAGTVHDRAERLGRRVQMIAESDLNDPRLVRAREIGGYGLDGQWTDDFHHALHAVLTREDAGYYADFGAVSLLGAALKDGYVFTGQRSAYRNRRHGAPPSAVPGERFVVCAQNHDQVGNRMKGERLSALVDDDELALAAVTVLVSPFVPLLFMGEEYGEDNPFLYFVSHTDAELVEAVRNGRREEFAAFRWSGEPPDPQDEDTFRRSVLDHGKKRTGDHARLLDLHTQLLRLRREVPALRNLDRDRIDIVPDDAARTLAWRRWTRDGDHAVIAVNFGDAPATVEIGAPPGDWHQLLSTADAPEALVSDTGLSLPLEESSAAVYRLERRSEL